MSPANSHYDENQWHPPPGNEKRPNLTAQNPDTIDPAAEDRYSAAQSDYSMDGQRMFSWCANSSISPLVDPETHQRTAAWASRPSRANESTLWEHGNDGAEWNARPDTASHTGTSHNHGVAHNPEAAPNPGVHPGRAAPQTREVREIPKIRVREPLPGNEQMIPSHRDPADSDGRLLALLAIRALESRHGLINDQLGIKDRQLENKDRQLENKDCQLESMSRQLENKDRQLENKDCQLESMSRLLESKNRDKGLRNLLKEKAREVIHNLQLVGKAKQGFSKDPNKELSRMVPPEGSRRISQLWKGKPGRDTLLLHQPSVGGTPPNATVIPPISTAGPSQAEASANVLHGDQYNQTGQHGAVEPDDGPHDQQTRPRPASRDNSKGAPPFQPSNTYPMKKRPNLFADQYSPSVLRQSGHFSPPPAYPAAPSTPAHWTTTPVATSSPARSPTRRADRPSPPQATGQPFYPSDWAGVPQYPPSVQGATGPISAAPLPSNSATSHSSSHRPPLQPHLGQGVPPPLPRRPAAPPSARASPQHHRHHDSAAGIRDAGQPDLLRLRACLGTLETTLNVLGQDLEDAKEWYRAHSGS